MKVTWKGGTMLYPVPAALVTCGDTPECWNMLTVAWCGTVCTEPPMLSVSIRPERYSHALIERCMEFTVCLTTQAMVKAVDWAGVRSGRDNDKWTATGLTPMPGVAVRSPQIEQSPLCLECRVQQIMRLGSHDMFLARVLDVQADDRYIDAATGRFSLDKADLIAWSHGQYHPLGPSLGHFGFSVRRRPKDT